MNEEVVEPKENAQPSGDTTSSPAAGHKPAPEGEPSARAEHEAEVGPQDEAEPPVEVTQPAAVEGAATPAEPESSPTPDDEEAATEFAPTDIRDGRRSFEWASRYSKQAKREITLEAVYLFVLLYSIPITMTLIWSKWLWGDIGLGEERYLTLARFAYAWLVECSVEPCST